MAVARQTWTLGLLLVTSRFAVVELISVLTSRPEITVNVGTDALLDCKYTTAIGTSFTLDWRFVPGSAPNAQAMKILYYTNGETYKLGPKSKRLKLVNEPPTRGIASIRLEKTESSDSGKYICDINNPPDFAGTSEIFVNLIVQVPPSTPQCTVSGKPHVGNNITLSCRSTEGRPSPVYVWSEVNPSPGTSAATNVKKDNSKGTLTLRNLTEGNSGTYRCVASNILGQDLCHVVLTVTYNNELGVIVGAVFGTSIALILIGAVAYCLLHRRADHPKPVFVGNELREDALAPGKDPNSQLLESSIALRPGVSHSTDSKYNIVV